MAPKSKKATTNLVTAETKIENRGDMKRIETRKGTLVVIPGVKSEILTTLVIGEAPLIVHNFSQKAREQYRRKQEGEASGGREHKDCIANFEGARYRLSDGSDGMPAAGWKACLVGGFDKGSGVPMTKAVGAIRVEADDPATNLVRILHPIEPKEIAEMPHVINETGRIPRCREDVVRNESGVIDLRHRPEFWPWACQLRIRFLPSICSARQVLQAIAMSGFTIGQCEWRPRSKESKSGSYGTFRLATPAEVEAFADGRLFEDHEWPTLEGLKEAAE
jgi:hypothetical protein